MRIWKRALATVLALTLAVPTPVTPVFAEEMVDEFDYAVPEALTPELDDEVYGADSFAEEDDFWVESDEDFAIEEWDVSADEDAAYMDTEDFIVDMDADSGDFFPEDAGDGDLSRCTLPYRAG